MVKVFAFYKNIRDMNRFLEFYTNVLIPKINKLPGIVDTNIIHLDSMTPDVPQDLDGLQMIVESIHQSKESATTVLTSPEGLEISQLLADSSLAEMYIYWGTIKNFNPENATNVVNNQNAQNKLNSPSDTDN